MMEEESYLLKMGQWQAELIRSIKTDALLITPEKYKTEILSFLEGETLEDISISRKNVTWGIPLPFDETHTTYVWVDAFLNYLTALEWDGDTAVVPVAWPADVELIGKDILRVHATIWPVLLLHLGLPLQKCLYVNGMILSGGRKMSKTMGNVISVDEMLEHFGADGTRYLLLASGPYGADVDITMERMTEMYNADLANGLGNLVSRVMKLSESLGGLPTPNSLDTHTWLDLSQEEILDRPNTVMTLVKSANHYMDETKPWKLVKENTEEFEKVMALLFEYLQKVVFELTPLMPGTAQKIADALKTGAVEPLFQRIV
jgi:methionyl-tRNA synthetase